MKLRVLLLVVTIVLMSVSAFAEEYSFRVRNTTDKKITKILVSEDGVEYGFFNIGKGIEPGKTVNLVWDSSTNGENCEQYVKAVFANGEDSNEERVVVIFELARANALSQRLGEPDDGNTRIRYPVSN